MKKLLFVLLVCTPAFAQLPSSAPPMGWSSYFYSGYIGGCAPTETIVKAQADAMRTTMDSHYKLVGLDCGWANQTRTGGLQTANATKFPSGIPSLVSYIHGHGQYIGIYSTPGPASSTNCGNGPGSYGFETTDASTFANWRIDYLKYDFCTGSTVYANTTPGVENAYQVMATALAGTVEPTMYYLASVPELSYGYGNGWTWFQAVGASEYWANEVANDATLDLALFSVPWATYQPYQNKGHWLNGDFLICGHYTIYVSNGGSGPQAVTDGDCQTQFALWSMIAAPLVVSVDITTLDAQALATLNNTEVIAVDQDSLGLMGAQLTNVACGSSFCPVWTRTLANGTIAVGLFNRDSAAHSVTLNFSSLSTGTTHYEVRDLYTHTNLGVMTSYTAASVPPPGSVAASSDMILLTATLGGSTLTEGVAKGAVIQ
jgi:alpha-galactosidase